MSISSLLRVWCRRNPVEHAPCTREYVCDGLCAAAALADRPTAERLFASSYKRPVLDHAHRAAQFSIRSFVLYFYLFTSPNHHSKTILLANTITCIVYTNNDCRFYTIIKMIIFLFVGICLGITIQMRKRTEQS